MKTEIMWLVIEILSIDLLVDLSSSCTPQLSAADFFHPFTQETLAPLSFYKQHKIIIMNRKQRNKPAHEQIQDLRILAATQAKTINDLESRVKLFEMGMAHMNRARQLEKLSRDTIAKGEFCYSCCPGVT